MMVTLLVIVSQALRLTLHRTAVIGVYLEYQTYGMKYYMLIYCQWDSEPSDIRLHNFQVTSS
jgi:hypothetical protein